MNASRLPGLLLCVVSTALVLALARPAAAVRPHKPILVQVTHNTVGQIWQPQIRSSRGDSVVFVSDGDVMGPGTETGHREVYYYDSESGTLSRVTNTADGESYDATAETDDQHSGRPPVVVFISTGDLDPSVGNDDHNPEVFVWHSETGQTIQLTDTQPPVVNAEPYVSDSSRCIAFRSNADLDDNDGSDATNPGAGFDNLDGSDEIFNMRFPDTDFVGRVVTQVSNGPAGTISSHPAVGGFWFTRQCRSTAYQSDHDHLGNGSTGLHIYNYTKTSGRVEQVSMPGDGVNRNPSMSGASNFARGPFVIFESNMDPMENGGSGSFEIFNYRLFKPLIGQFTLDSVDTANPVVADGGGFVTFQSRSELIDGSKKVKGGGTPPFNADGNQEIFRADRFKKLAQLTRTENCENTDPTSRDTGRATAFRSTCDLIPGHNPAGVAQVFHYWEVPRRDPIYLASNCLVSEACCNQNNGCYELILGKKSPRPRRNRTKPPWGVEGTFP